MKEKPTENVQGYLSGISAYIGNSIATSVIMQTELKNTTLKEECDQLGIKILFINPFHPEGNSGIKNMQNFLKRTLTKFLESSDLECDELLQIV